MLDRPNSPDGSASCDRSRTSRSPTSARAFPRPSSCSGSSPRATPSRSTRRSPRSRRPRPSSSCRRRTPARSRRCTPQRATSSRSAPCSSRTTSGERMPSAPPRRGRRDAAAADGRRSPRRRRSPISSATAPPRAARLARSGASRCGRLRARPRPTPPSSRRRRTTRSTCPTSSDDPLERPRSTPPVRQLAKHLGVDLALVEGTGDVRPHHARGRRGLRGRACGAASVADRSRVRRGAVRAPQTPGERTTRTPIRGVRKHTAEAMVRSAFTAPHVTTFLTVDVTATTELVASLKADRRCRTTGSASWPSPRRRCASRSRATPASTPAGTRPPARSSSTTTSTSASPRRPAAASWSRTSGTRRSSTSSSWPMRSAASPRRRARAGPRRPR